MSEGKRRPAHWQPEQPHMLPVDEDRPPAPPPWPDTVPVGAALQPSSGPASFCHHLPELAAQFYRTACSTQRLGLLKYTTGILPNQLEYITMSCGGSVKIRLLLLVAMVKKTSMERATLTKQEEHSKVLQNRQKSFYWLTPVHPS